MTKLVTVYTPSGDPEQHTLPNARDLVNGARYSWKQNVESAPTEFTPAAYLPTAAEKAALAKKPRSQEIFDGHSVINADGKIDENPPAPPAEPDEVIPPPVEEGEAVKDLAPDVVVDLAPEAAPVEIPRAPRAPRKFGGNT